MKEITQFENYTVEIRRRAFQRHMHLSVRPDGTIRVTCGRRMARAEIQRFVVDSKPFILNSLKKWEEQGKRLPKKNFVSHEPLLFFGEHWPIDVVWSWNERVRVRLQADAKRLEILAPLKSTREERLAGVQRFFKNQARLHLQERMEHFSKKMALAPFSTSIRGQTTRWGSCSGRGEISLNWKLLCAPLFVIDYVVVHELAHLEHPNHSPRFWNLVAENFPHYKEAKSWLRKYEHEIANQFS